MAFTDIEALAQFLELDKKKAASLLQNPEMPLLVPMRLAAKMAKNSVKDPLFREFVPQKMELKKKEGFSSDPLKESDFQKNRLLQKYRGRALLLCADSCYMHCRFCFRRHFAFPKASGFEAELTAIGENKTLSEIILSGGEPLLLSNEKLAGLFARLNAMPHIKRIRIHSRALIAAPERADAGLLAIFAKSPKQLFFVQHVNHPKELDSEVLPALKQIGKQNMIVLTQTVLLKGVNDDPKVLIELFLALSNNGILPYYLHLLDKVSGIAHFDVPLSKARSLMTAIKAELPGYAVPRLVREIPHKTSKTTFC